MNKKLSIEEQVRIAINRFTATSDGKWPRPFARLDNLNVDRATKSRAIKDAFIEGHVKIVATDPGGARPIRDLRTEQRIRERFGVTSIVLRPIIEGADRKSADSLNDAIHRQLGVAMGRFISQGAILRDDDRIACSSGRSCYHTVHYLAGALLTSCLKRITLISMAGNLHPRHYASLGALKLDADFNTQEFARWFNNEVDAHYVGRHAIPQSNVAALRGQNDALSDSTWRDPVHVAIYGVGILRPGHRFYSVVEHPHPDFDPILSDLRALKQISDEFSADGYCPVADIANHLLYIHPPSGIHVPARVQTRIRTLIERVNQKTLTVTATHIEKIRNGVLIAGTPQKAAAVCQLIREQRVGYLCVDFELASRLLEFGDPPPAGGLQPVKPRLVNPSKRG